MYEELKARDITPDEPTYNRIMYALMNAKREDESIELYEVSVQCISMNQIIYMYAHCIKIPQTMNSKGIRLSQTAPDLYKIIESWIDRRSK
mgnify:CR=1 FL=1